MPTLLAPPSAPSSGSGSSSWFAKLQKPENIIALLPAFGIGLLLFYFWGKISAFVLEALQNAVSSLLALGELFAIGLLFAAILWVLFDSTFRNFLWYLYRGAIRKGMSIFVNMDKISVLKGYLTKLKLKREEFQTGVNDINAQKIETQRQIAKDAKAYKDACSMFAAARQAGNTRIGEVQANQMKRMHAVLETESEDLKRIFSTLTLLGQYRDMCDDSILDWSNEIEVREREDRRSKSLKKAFSSAWSILHGNPDDDEMRDMALKGLEQEYAARIGEVEQVLEMSKVDVDTYALKNSAAVAEADRLYNEWKSANPELPLDTPKPVTTTQLTAGTSQPSGITLAPAKVKEPASIEDWFGKRGDS